MSNKNINTLKGKEGRKRRNEKTAAFSKNYSKVVRANNNQRPSSKRNNKSEHTHRKSYPLIDHRKQNIKIYFLGGINEVGKNMTVFECNDEMIIVDCGLAFPDETMPGVDLVIPDFTFVEENREKIKGIWLKILRRLCNYESLRHPFYSLLLIVVASVVFVYCNSNEIGDSWKYLYVSLILVGWLNFAAYAVIIRIAIHKFNAYVGEKKNELLGPFNDINNDYGEQIVFQKVKNECSPQSTISLKVPSPASTNKTDGNSPAHTSKPTRPRNNRHRKNQRKNAAADFTQKQEGTDTPPPPTGSK